MITTDLESIVNDPEINIVIEVMGGIEPARTLILEAIKNRSQSLLQISATCNYGHELFNAADAAKSRFITKRRCRDSIIRSMRESLAGDQITRVIELLTVTNYGF